MDNNLSQFCQKHPNKTIQIYCLDTLCKAGTLCCILCLKNEHAKCKEQFLLDKHEIKEKLQLQDKNQGKQKTIQKLNRLIEQQLLEVNHTLQNSKNNFLASLNKNCLKKQQITPDIIKNIKKNHKIQVDPKNNKIQLTSSYNSDRESIEECIIIYEQTLKQKVKNLLSDFQKLSLMVHGNLLTEDFIHHPSIQLTESNNSILVQRKVGDSAFNYYCCLYKNPLLQQHTFKITILEVYNNDRYVDVGIISKTKFQQLQNNFINTYNSGGISFCGYSCSGGVTGNYMTTSSGDAKGFRPGLQFYVQYTPGKIIKFWDDVDGIDVVKSMIHTSEEYYFFCTVYHPQTKFTIEKIEGQNEQINQKKIQQYKMAKKTQAKKQTKKAQAPKQTQKVNAIDVAEIIDTQAHVKHTPLNLARFDQKLSQFVQNSPYRVIAKRLIADYKNKKLIASEFKFNEDVIKIIKHQINANQV